MEIEMSIVVCIFYLLAVISISSFIICMVILRSLRNKLLMIDEMLNDVEVDSEVFECLNSDLLDPAEINLRYSERVVLTEDK